MITAIDHPKLLCPHCNSTNIKLYKTKALKRANKKIYKVDRYFECKECKETFKTFEIL